MLKAFFASFSGQIVGVLMLLAIISACSLDTDKTSSPLTLSGTQWNLKTLDGQAVTTDKPPTVQFDTNRMSGYAGCNQFFGNYTGSSDGVFSTSNIGSTKMACIGDKDQLEHTFLEKLQQASQYAMILDQLHLLDNQRHILMVLDAAKPAADKTK